jgi:hypothetical protein
MWSAVFLDVTPCGSKRRSLQQPHGIISQNKAFFKIYSRGRWVLGQVCTVARGHTTGYRGDGLRGWRRSTTCEGRKRRHFYVATCYPCTGGACGQYAADIGPQSRGNASVRCFGVPEDALTFRRQTEFRWPIRMLTLWRTEASARPSRPECGSRKSVNKTEYLCLISLPSNFDLSFLDISFSFCWPYDRIFVSYFLVFELRLIVPRYIVQFLLSLIESYLPYASFSFGTPWWKPLIQVSLFKAKRLHYIECNEWFLIS